MKFGKFSNMVSSSICFCPFSFFSHKQSHYAYVLVLIGIPSFSETYFFFIVFFLLFELFNLYGYIFKFTHSFSARSNLHLSPFSKYFISIILFFFILEFHLIPFDNLFIDVINSMNCHGTFL